MRGCMLLVTLIVASWTATTVYSYPTSNNTDATANHPQPLPSNVKISKEIFLFSPPAEQKEDLSYISDFPIIPRNRIRVIFIRSPLYPNLTNALADLVKTKAEQRTIIYVLNKQTDLSGLTQKLHEIKQERRNKPEVRFVKYRTSKDAETAVRSIQNLYMGLGGATHIHADQTAPVVEFTWRRSR